LQQSSGGALEL